MRHGVKISLSLLLTLCIMALCIMPCFAVGLALDAIDIWSIGLQAYNDSHGVITYYTTNGYFNNNTPEFSQSTYQQLWNNLFNEYRTYDSTQAAIDAWADTYANSVLPFGTPIDGSDIIHLAIELKPAVVEWYDNFANWLLGVKMGVPSDSGHYHTSGSFANNNISSINGEPEAGTMLLMPQCDGTASGVVTNGYPLTSASGGSYYWATNVPDVFAFYYRPAGGYGDIVLVSKNSSMLGYRVWYNGNGLNTFSNIQSYRNDYYYIDTQFYTTYQWLSNNSGLPSFENLNSGLEYFVGNYEASSGSSAIALAPKQKVRDNNGDIYIPQPSDINYVPEGINVPTNIEYSPSNSSTDNLTDILDKIIEQTSPWDLADSITPSPVTSPFIPFNLPSFNFNFSGIWHYVVSWIGSLRSGFAFISSCWSALPYQMIIPIYASAVVVIVIGTYKRFFT